MYEIFFAFKIKINLDFRKFYMVRSLFLLLENLFSVYGVILCWFLLYMIFSDNNTRSHFIKKLQHFGLRRVQKSVFSGFLELEERLDLASAFDEFLSCEKDSIMLIPTCESCANSILTDGELKMPHETEYEFL